MTDFPVWNPTTLSHHPPPTQGSLLTERKARGDTTVPRLCEAVPPVSSDVRLSSSVCSGHTSSCSQNMPGLLPLPGTLVPQDVSKDDVPIFFSRLNVTSWIRLYLKL